MSVVYICILSVIILLQSIKLKLIIIVSYWSTWRMTFVNQRRLVYAIYISLHLLSYVIALIPLSVEHSGCCWINDCEEIAQQD